MMGQAGDEEEGTHTQAVCLSDMDAQNNSPFVQDES